MDKPKRKRKYPIEFRPSNRLRLLYAIGLLLFFFGCLISLFAIVVSPFLAIGWITWIIWLIFVPLFYFSLSALWTFTEHVFSLRYAVTKDGIWIYYNGERFYPWHHLISVRFEYQSFWIQGDFGIHTQPPLNTVRSWIGRWLITEWGKSSTFISLSLFINIPRNWLLRPDVQSFQKTEFGQILYDHAPHLFEDAEKPKKNKPSEDDITPYLVEDSQASDEQYG